MSFEDNPASYYSSEQVQAVTNSKNPNKNFKYSQPEEVNKHGQTQLKRNALDEIIKNKKVQEYA
jgi:hypothetical protein